MDRAELLAEVSDRLGGRQLVWFGTRGDDIESVTDLEPLTHAYSLISSYRRRPSVESLALEELTGHRIDLDTYELDDHLRAPEVVALRHHLLRALARPSAVFTYRPTGFLSAATFARRDRCTYLGMFKDHQAAFEHKPWVETAVAELGIPHIPWTYVADEDQLDTLRYLADGPVVLRRSRTTGGVGLTLVDDVDRLLDLWPDEEEAYVSVAPFYAESIPVNVGAVVWRDGVTVHPASVQLIGVPTCTHRPFGYCGNDFGAVRTLPTGALHQIERAVTAIGSWLGQFGYVGGFGVDFLVVDGIPLFTEVNPRFQGSTHLSCQISTEAGQSCLLLEHIAAFLGLPAPATVPIEELANMCGDWSHVVVHRTGAARTGVDPAPLAAALGARGARRVDVTTDPQLVTETGSTVLRATFSQPLTSNGFDLDPEIDRAIAMNVRR